jgi:hypothetical protein
VVLVGRLGVILGGLLLVVACQRSTLGGEDSGGSDGSDGGDDGVPTAPGDGGGGTGGSSSASSSAGGGSSTSGGGSSSSSSSSSGDGSSSDDGGAFIADHDIWPDPSGPCDPGLQDCPDGWKCTGYVSEPGYCCVDATKCVPIIGNKTFGEPCTRTEDNDDCDKGFFCMGKTSGSIGAGICLELCVPNAPDQCVFGSVCRPWADNPLALCQTLCDPVLQDCPEDWGCYGVIDHFMCAVPGPEQGQGNDGDECYTIQSCLPGLECMHRDSIAGCTADTCCTPFCDVTGPATQCPEPTEDCVPWFEPGMEPPDHDHIGYCGVG